MQNSSTVKSLARIAIMPLSRFLIATITTTALTMAALGCVNDDNQTTQYCGEAFCVVGNTTTHTKSSPIEDFNIYQLVVDGRRVSIYEGNNPRLDPAGELIGELISRTWGEPISIMRTQRGMEAKISTGRPWPNYLVVFIRCSADEPCDIRPIANSIIPRP